MTQSPLRPALHPSAPALLSAVCVAAGALPGCVSSHTFVLQRPEPRHHYNTVALAQQESTVDVDADSADHFRAALEASLSRDAGLAIQPAADLVIRYKFTLFESGEPAVRVGSGVANLAGSPLYGLGDGVVGVEVVFADLLGHTLGHIVADGPVTGAFGSSDAALDSAAVAIARYTKAQFGPRDQTTVAAARGGGGSATAAD
jgi:hypothetical protein